MPPTMIDHVEDRMGGAAPERARLADMQAERWGVTFSTWPARGVDLRVVAESPQALVNDSLIRVVDTQDRDSLHVQVVLDPRPGINHPRGKPLSEGTQVPHPAPRLRDSVMLLRKPQVLRAETARQRGIPPARRRRHTPKPPEPPTDELDRAHRHNLIEPSLTFGGKAARRPAYGR